VMLYWYQPEPGHKKKCHSSAVAGAASAAECSSASDPKSRTGVTPNRLLATVTAWQCRPGLRQWQQSGRRQHTARVLAQRRSGQRLQPESPRRGAMARVGSPGPAFRVTSRQPDGLGPAQGIKKLTTMEVLVIRRSILFSK
jgi:hypothetical protein